MSDDTLYVSVDGGESVVGFPIDALLNSTDQLYYPVLEARRANSRWIGALAGAGGAVGIGWFVATSPVGSFSSEPQEVTSKDKKIIAVAAVTTALLGAVLPPRKRFKRVDPEAIAGMASDIRLAPTVSTKGGVGVSVSVSLRNH